ncbi:MAG: rod shape-determining protein MreC [Prevotella sp.]|jgi:rod shape-determining protein MreC|nr:rod shape-determining protein MreC [Prevotella sp.]
MRNLFAFLIKNINWFLFILLEAVGFFMVFEYNSYQRSIFFNSTNEIRGRMYSVSNKVTSYFGLRSENERLTLQNAALQKRLLELENYVNTLPPDTLRTNAFSPDNVHETQYSYMLAHVIDNSVSHVENYIVLNKGKNDSVDVDMGVASMNGIVGFVREVSPNYALVQSVLNPNTQLNCKIKGSNVHTTLVWDGRDPRYATLKDFPRYERFAVGDTVITSGVSKFFPEGFIVGIIKGSDSQKDDNFLTLKIALSTDFSSLHNVLVINNYYRRELNRLRKEVGIE